jgi:hypothetical protein
MPPMPTALGMKLCDYVITEALTGKETLVGCLTGIALDEFPGRAPPFMVHAELTDSEGFVAVDLVVTDLATWNEVLKVPTRLYFPSRLAVVQYHKRLTNATFSRAGLYQFSLLVNGESVAQRTTRVYLRGERP